MDAKAIYGYIMLYRVQMYLFTVAAHESLEFVAEHRFQSFVKDPNFDVALAQAIEAQLNKYCTAVYVQATSNQEWEALTKEADLRSMMNARYLRTTVPQ